MKSATPFARWNPAEYAANSAVQLSWARELIAKLKLRGDEHILDVGCGDGKVTAELARAVTRGSATGVDASAEMIAFARKSFPPSAILNLKFQICDARDISLKSKFDLVFSNAALHWVDDHEAILRGASRVLKSGGRLVVSCGGKGNAHDVFLALRPEMRLKRWREYFRRMPMPYYFHAPGNYEKWLAQSGFETQSIKLVPVDAIYDGAAGFATWLRTTWLPFVQRVPEAGGQASRLSRFEGVPPSLKITGETPSRQTGETPAPQLGLREEFIAAVTARYLAKHPPDKAGRVRVRMVRLEIDAVKN